MTGSKSTTRRRFLASSLGLGTLALLPEFASAKMTDARVLAFHNLHTGERIEAAYWENGRYIGDVLKAFSWEMRDHRTDQAHPINPRLLEYLFLVRTRLASRSPFEIVSGYRTPSSNHGLAERGGRVAKTSYHMRGMAVDVKLPGRELAHVRQAAISLHFGGVGYYPRDRFVHLDIGNPRSW